MTQFKKHNAAIVSILLGVATLLVTGIFLFTAPRPSIPNSDSPKDLPDVTNTPHPTSIPTPLPLPTSKTIQSLGHTFQTFNNCGPATYSMMLQYVDIKVPQKELGDRLRPYQVAGGDNDDKSVSMEEIAQDSQRYDLISIHRPNGTIEKLKQFIAADQPIVLRTWLNNKDDIGHFIIVRGYDDTTNQIVFDDSYYAPNRKTTYQELLSLWQPFNYEYLILVKEENKEKIEQILKEESNIQLAWENAQQRSIEETRAEPQNPFPPFNNARASFYLGNYEQTINVYESIKAQLPSRMLWYQYEPILAYEKLGKTKEVFSLIDAILNNNNRAYSELYTIKARIYISNNQIDQAKKELELALRYNQNYQEAKDLLTSL